MEYKYKKEDIVILTPDDDACYGTICALAKIIGMVPLEPWPCYEIQVICNICSENHFYTSNDATFVYESEILRMATEKEKILYEVIYS